MVALSDNGKCNPFPSLWPRLTQTSFFPQLYLYFATCLVLPFISIWPRVCFFFYVRLLFVFCASSLPLSFRQIWSELAVLKISAFQHTQSNRILSLTVETAEIFYIWTNYCRISARHFFLLIKLFLLFLVKTYRNCNCNFCEQPFIIFFLLTPCCLCSICDANARWSTGRTTKEHRINESAFSWNKGKK